MSNTSMQSVAAAAAIGQEPITCHVDYAVTGDPEVDLVAGILAVYHKGDWDIDPNGPITSADPFTIRSRKQRVMHRVCLYLAQRFAHEAEHNEAVARKMAQTALLQQQYQEEQQKKLGTYSSPCPPPASPYTLGDPLPPQIYTTSGTSGLMGALSNEAVNTAKIKFREMAEAAKLESMIEKAKEKFDAQ